MRDTNARQMPSHQEHLSAVWPAHHTAVPDGAVDNPADRRRITGGRIGDALWAAADRSTGAVDALVDDPWAMWIAPANCPHLSTPRWRSSRRCAEDIQPCASFDGTGLCAANPVKKGSRRMGRASASVLFPTIHRPYDYLLLSSSLFYKNEYGLRAPRSKWPLDVPDHVWMWIANSCIHVSRLAAAGLRRHRCSRAE